MRYRIEPLQADGGAAPMERLQWHSSDGMRRFECRPERTRCRWHELARGSTEYLIEVPAVLRLYTLHRRRLALH